MKRFLDAVRNNILIVDPYMITLFLDIQQQIRVRYADIPLFPEGTPQQRTAVILAQADGAPHPVIPNVYMARFYIDIFSNSGFKACEDIWFNTDPNILTTYTYPQGIQTLLHNRSFIASDIHVERFFNIKGPVYSVNDASKLWFLTTLWVANIITLAPQRAA